MRKRIAAARINRIARKKRASAPLNANFATTNPELQITMKNQAQQILTSSSAAF
jgi:hypothetical protein